MADLADSGETHSGPLATLKNRDFSLLWAGQMFGQMASSMQLVVVAWQIYEMTDSTLSVGLAGLARALPVIVFSLFGGVVADAMDRRKVLLATQALTFAASALLAALTTASLINPLVIYLAVFAIGAATSFDFPARRALVPMLVQRHQIPSAATLILIARRGSGVVGPMIGAGIIALFGTALAHWAVVASVVVLIVLLLLMRGRTVNRAGRAAGGIAMFFEGMRFLWGIRPLLMILVFSFVLFIFANTRSVWPALARDVFEAGPTGLGLLASSASIGTVAGLLLALRLGDLQRKGLITLLCGLGMGICVLWLASSPWLVLAALALVTFGVIDSLNDSLRNTLIATATPEALQGRVNSASTAFGSGGESLGDLWVGFLAAALGPKLGLEVAGAAVVVGSLAMLIFARQLVRYRGGVAPEP